MDKTDNEKNSIKWTSIIQKNAAVAVLVLGLGAVKTMLAKNNFIIGTVALKEKILRPRKKINCKKRQTLLRFQFLLIRQ